MLLPAVIFSSFARMAAQDLVEFTVLTGRHYSAGGGLYSTRTRPKRLPDVCVVSLS